MKSFDKSFFWTKLSPYDSGLTVKVHVTCRITNRRPTLLVEIRKRIVSVLINKKPRILTGHLEKGLKNEIFEWVIIKQKFLIEYWNAEYRPSI